ncbi:MAG: nitrilase-related carbon-nitrogen hydrolase, partial [Sphingopyxis terrae]|uniref:nitrilase-related carbon-nitrogen hydrolase n=1 Tax=Sphingopyxis terrae TaxID=33052 RepID=UPI003F7DE4C4
MTDAPAATLSIVLSQMTQSVGDLAANVDAMRTVRARHQDADLILYPELQLIGYPPEDLVLKPALAERAARLLTELAADTADGGPAMLVGSVERDGDGRLYNIVALLDGG